MGTKRERERGFSLDLASKTQLRKVSMNDGEREGTTVSGTIGRLVDAHFIDGVVLEIEGHAGTLRVDLQEDELVKNPDREEGGE
jgi:hypothetical protein